MRATLVKCANLTNFTDKVKFRNKYFSILENIYPCKKAMPVILLANKCDLAALKVPRHKYSTYVQENGLLAW